MKKAALLLSIITFNSFANELVEREREVLLTPKPAEDVTSSDANTFPEIYLNNESILQKRNLDTGRYSDPYFTAEDNYRLAIGYALSQDYEDFTKVSTMEMNLFSKLSSNYKDLWWNLQLKRVTAKHSAISEDSTATNNTLRADNLQSFTIGGIGFGHRFKTLAKVFETDRLFETINVYANYIFHKDATDEEQYQGYGFTATYGLGYRSSNSFFYGLRFSYDWAFVERAAEDSEEKLEDRSLVFGWTAIGFETGYYF